MNQNYLHKHNFICYFNFIFYIKFLQKLIINILQEDPPEIIDMSNYLYTNVNVTRKTKINFRCY